jgi:thiamine biosynthesis lipoprotein
VPRQPGAGALSDAASKPIFIEGQRGWRDAAARMGAPCAMWVDVDGAVHVTRCLEERLRFTDRNLVAEVVE